jgi:hypothetical protein
LPVIDVLDEDETLAEKHLRMALEKSNSLIVISDGSVYVTLQKLGTSQVVVRV